MAERFPLTPGGYTNAFEWLRDNDLAHLVYKELSVDGFSIINLANKLYREKESGFDTGR